MIYGLKDCFCKKNEPLGLGLKEKDLILRPTYSSTVYQLLKKKDNQILKSELMQFCCVSWDYSLKQKDGLIVAGSSTGAVLDLEGSRCEVAICTDTGGSTIVPAARARLYGFKPTYGRISRYGLNPLCSYLDTVSLMSKDLNLIVKAFKDLDHPDVSDLKCIPLSKRVNLELAPIHIAKNLFESEDLQQLKKFFPNAELTNLIIPPLWVLEGAYYYILLPDFYSNLMKFDGVQNKVPDTDLYSRYQSIDSALLRGNSLNVEVKSRVLLGAQLLESYSYRKFFSFVNHLNQILGSKTWILPVAEDLRKNQDLEYYEQQYVYLANLTHRPSLVIPNNLKKGFQVVGPKNTDYSLLKLVYLDPPLNFA